MPAQVISVIDPPGPWGDDRGLSERIDRMESRLVDGRSFGVVGDGVSDDTRAIVEAAEFAYSNKATLYISGSPSIYGPIDLTHLYGVKIIGSGHNASPSYGNVATRIVQHADNEPIFKLWGPCDIRDLYLAYGDQQTTAHTDSIALELNKISGGYFRNLKIYRANTAVGIKQAGFSGSDNWVFDSVFDNLKLYGASECFLDMRTFSGGSTNVAFHNLYINGLGAANFSNLGQECNHAIRGSAWKGFFFDTMSIDAVTFNDTPIDIEGNCIWNAGSIRFEACQVTQDDANWIEDAGSHSSFHLGSLEMKNSRWDADTPGSMYLFRAAASHTVLTVGDVFCDSDCNFGASGTRRVLSQTATDVGSGYVSKIEFGPLYDASGTLTGVNAWVQGTGTALRVPVQEWDGARTRWWEQGGRVGAKRAVVLTTAIPTAETWTAGDRCIIIPAVEGLPTEYICTTGGTPGTWRPSSQTVKRGTTGQRPSPVASDVGLLYLDNTLDADGKPIWWNGTAWIDATGATA